MAGNCPKDSVVPVRTIPSYLPVPASASDVCFGPSLMFRTRYLSPSLSIDSHMLRPVFLPSIELLMPTQRKATMSKGPPGGLLRVVPVSSKLEEVWVFENAMALLAPDQQLVMS